MLPSLSLSEMLIIDCSVLRQYNDTVFSEFGRLNALLDY